MTVENYITNLKHFLTTHGYENHFSVNGEPGGRLEKSLKEYIDQHAKNEQVENMGFRLVCFTDFKDKNDYSTCCFHTLYNPGQGFTVYKMHLERHRNENLVVSIELPIDNKDRILSRRAANQIVRPPAPEEKQSHRHRFKLY